MTVPQTENQNCCARYGHSSAIYKNRLYIYSGYDHENKQLHDVWMLDLKTQMWSQLYLSSLPNDPTESKTLLNLGNLLIFYINHGLVETEDGYKLCYSIMIYNLDTKKQEIAAEFKKLAVNGEFKLVADPNRNRLLVVSDNEGGHSLDFSEYMRPPSDDKEEYIRKG